MTAESADARVPLTKAQFLQVFRWQRQVGLTRLAALLGLSATDLAALEAGREAGPGPAHQLAELFGLSDEAWGQVGQVPGYPGTGPLLGKRARESGLNAFADQVNRIAAMPEAFRLRQFDVIHRELAYLDA